MNSILSLTLRVCVSVAH